MTGSAKPAKRHVTLGFSEERVRRIIGWADRKVDAQDPMDQANNRVELILLRTVTGAPQS